jgi:hypothetical protein
MRLYAQHVTHRDGEIYLWRDDAVLDASAKFARIMGWDEGGLCMPDHLRRIAWDVQEHMHKAVTAQFLVSLPNGRLVKTSGSLPVNLAVAEDGAPLGWCKVIPRRNGNAGRIIIQRGADPIGEAIEHMSNRSRLNRERPTVYHGQLFAPKSRKLFYSGKILLRRPMMLASFASLEVSELGEDIDQRQRELDGMQEATLVRIAVADAIRTQLAQIPQGQMQTIYTAARLAGRDPQEDVRQIVLDLFGQALAA